VKIVSHNFGHSPLRKQLYLTVLLVLSGLLSLNLIFSSRSFHANVRYLELTSGLSPFIIRHVQFFLNKGGTLKHTFSQQLSAPLAANSSASDLLLRLTAFYVDFSYATFGKARY